jgi:hypothetical protein
MNRLLGKDSSERLTYLESDEAQSVQQERRTSVWVSKRTLQKASLTGCAVFEWTRVC